MAKNIGKVSINGLIDEVAQVTWNLAAGIVKADEGKAVTQDTTAANTVKLAGDGDLILGRLEIVEIRSQEGIAVGTVSMRGGMSFVVNPNATASSPDETPAVGDYLSGGTATDTTKGYVQKASTGNTVITEWRVAEVLDAGARVVAFKY